MALFCREYRALFWRECNALSREYWALWRKKGLFDRMGEYRALLKYYRALFWRE